MIEKFQADIAACVQALTHRESQDFCWKGGRNFLEGDWEQPSVGLILSTRTEPTTKTAVAHPFSVHIEPLLCARGVDGPRAANVQILNAHEMLIQEATDVGVAQILFDEWQRCLADSAGGMKENVNGQHPELAQYRAQHFDKRDEPMMVKIAENLATCVHALPDAEAQDLCWVSIRYSLEGDLVNPRVSMCVAPSGNSASDHQAQPLLGVDMETLLLTDDGAPLSDIRIENPQSKLLRFAEEAGVVAILCRLRNQALTSHAHQVGGGTCGQ